MYLFLCMFRVWAGYQVCCTDDDWCVNHIEASYTHSDVLVLSQWGNFMDAEETVRDDIYGCTFEPYTDAYALMGPERDSWYSLEEHQADVMGEAFYLAELELMPPECVEEDWPSAWLNCNDEMPEGFLECENITHKWLPMSLDWWRWLPESRQKCQQLRDVDPLLPGY